MRIKFLFIISIIFCYNISFSYGVEPNSDPIQRISFKFVGAAPENKYEAQIEYYLISLIRPITRLNPKVWDSPLIITNQKTGNSYQTEHLLVAEVYYVPQSKMVIVASYSGSMSYIHFFDIETGQEKYHKLALFTEKIIILNNQIIAYPGCEYGIKNNEDFCSCPSAKVYDFVRNFQPVYNRSKSKELTKQSIGVEFEGEHNIMFPKTSKAKIVKK